MGAAKPKNLHLLRVRAFIGDKSRGVLIVGPTLIPCALGRSGITQAKREGDGASPRGNFRFISGRYRPDRLRARPRTLLKLTPIGRHDGWCDDPGHRCYNRPIRLPAPGVNAEEMWRDDGLYDLVLDLGYNRGPIRPGRGSAIFMHIARPGFLPTEGCVALRRTDLMRLLQRLGPRSELCIR